MRRLFSFQTIYVCAFLIVIVSVIPISLGHNLKIPLDKIVHFFIYLTFAFLISNTLAIKRYKHSRLQGFAYSVVIGVMMEVVQYFLPYRSFEMLDILSNSLGALLGILIRVNL